TRGTPEMMRSEERAYIDTEQHETGHARLRKHVVTEDVRTTVPVSHEEVHVTREPISPEDRSRSGNARIEESQVEVTLHEERPVVRKETVPVERVRLDTEKVTEQEEVTTQVRKEQIEYDDGARERKGMTEGRGKHGREDRYS
ncbi:YsnF/AvaK domain-containing protein, partial [Streptomyces lycii]